MFNATEFYTLKWLNSKFYAMYILVQFIQKNEMKRNASAYTAVLGNGTEQMQEKDIQTNNSVKSDNWMDTLYIPPHPKKLILI